MEFPIAQPSKKVVLFLIRFLTVLIWGFGDLSCCLGVNQIRFSPEKDDSEWLQLVHTLFMNLSKFQTRTWVFPKMRVPQNRLFIMDNPSKMDDLGAPPILGTSPHICSWFKVIGIDSMGISGSKNAGTAPYKGRSSRDIPLHRPKK